MRLLLDPARDHRNSKAIVRFAFATIASRRAVRFVANVRSARASANRFGVFSVLRGKLGRIGSLADLRVVSSAP